MTLPTGTVTFLFTDIEGSTRLLQELGDDYEPALDEHRRLLRDAFAAHDGHEIGTEGDGFFVAFAKASDGLAAALKGQLALESHDWNGRPVRVRMGLHTGDAQLRGTDYIGLAVHQGARVSSAAHGGQILLSQTTRDLVGSAAPEGATFVDLGEHRLKDLAQPVRLFNLAHAGLQAEVPPPRTLSVLPNNLPLQLTTFVGRDEQLAKIEKLLENNRLVSLIGPGGSGKTRLALQMAAELVPDFDNGVWLADLSTITEGELVVRGFAEALGVREEKDRSVEDVLVEFLQGKDLLVVVDNCEHLAEESALIVDRLLHAATGLTVIATSREPLGAEGETVFRVPSLDTPKSDEPAEELAGYESVRLFCERASRSSGDFELTNDNAPAITEICRRLDGMPLAIELAAARVRMITPQEIAKRLDDRFKLLTGGLRTGIRRQQTLRAAVDWSYEMLSGAEQVLFRRLSVFVGGFTLESAEGVCAGEDLDTVDIFDLLGILVDRSLVVAEPHDGTTRYRLLETMREYGRELLAGSGEAPEVWGRHLTWFARLAEQSIEGLEGADETTWLARLDNELDNIRQALSWATSGGDALSGLNLAASLSRYWHIRWYVAEGYRWVRATLDIAGDVEDVGLRAKALFAAGALVANSGKLKEGRSHYEACVSLPITPETGRFIAEAMNDLGIVAWSVDGDIERARELLEQSLAIRRRIGHRPGIAESLNNVGSFEAWMGDRAKARPLIEEAVAIRRGLGAQTVIAHALSQLAGLASFDGDFTQAESYQREALEIRRRSGDLQGIASSLNTLGNWARLLGDYDAARALHSEALEVCNSREDPFGIGETTYHLAVVAIEQGRYDEARDFLGQTLDRGEAIGSEMYIAFTKDGLVALYRALGDLDEARSLSEEVLAFVRRGAPGQLPVMLGRRCAIERSRGDLGAAAALAEEVLELATDSNVPVQISLARHLIGLVALSAADFPLARTSLREALGLRAKLGLMPGVEQTLEALGQLSAAENDGERAAQLLRCAETLRTQMGTVIHPVDQADHDKAVGRAKQALGKDAFNAAWTAGSELTVDAAVALALS